MDIQRDLQLHVQDKRVYPEDEGSRLVLFQKLLHIPEECRILHSEAVAVAELHALPFTRQVFRVRLYNQTDTIPAGGQSRKHVVESWWLCQALAIGR